MTSADRAAERALYPVSILLGRERWAMRALLGDPVFAIRLSNWLRREPGIIQATANAMTGRVLVVFRPGAVRLDIGSLLREFLMQPVPVAAAVKPSPRRAALVRAVRAAQPNLRVFFVPVALTVAAQTLHLLQGNAFVRTVNRARLSRTDTPAKGGITSTLPFAMLLTGTDLTVQYQRRLAWRRAAQDTRERLRDAVVEQILRQDLDFFGHNGTGQLMDLVLADTQRIGELVERLPDQIIEKGITTAYAAVTLVTFSPRLAGVAALPLPLLLLPSLVLGSLLARRYGRTGTARAALSQTLGSVLAGITDVKLFQAEPQAAAQLHAQGESLAKSALDSFSAATITGLLTQAIGAGGFAMVAVYGGALARTGQLRPEDFARVLYLYPLLLSAVAEIETLISTYHDAVAAAERLTALIDSSPQIKSGPRHLAPDERHGAVAVEGVSFDYPSGQAVLRDVSFAVSPGEMVAVVGRSGSGKSTLLRLLARLYDVGSGRILLDGADIRDYDLTDLRSAVALVSQETYLFEGTIRDNLLYGRASATDEELVAILQQVGAAGLIERLPGGLDAQVGERGGRLSGGERQRVAIARAILRAAPLLLLDEITANLDYETEHAITRSVRSIARDRAVVVVTHRLATIRHAARIVVLHEGRVAETGTHRDLVASGGLYAELWRLQGGGGRRVRPG